MLGRIPCCIILTALFAPCAFSLEQAAPNKTAELSLQLSGIDFKKTKRDPGTDINTTILGHYLFLTDQFGVGPSLTYQRYLTAGLDDKEGLNFWSWDLGILAKVHFADINRDSMVPYALAEASVGQGKSDGRDTKSTKVRAGAGLNIFLNRYVAFAPELSYGFAWDKTESSGATQRADADKDMTTRVSIGLNVFL